MLLQGDEPQAIVRAAQRIQAGELVAFPTET
jgi:tRNA A37 threonylcarbamoyladenosine synthetase subunit TsaC/SUA5/YrdC